MFDNYTLRGAPREESRGIFTYFSGRGKRLKILGISYIISLPALAYMITHIINSHIIETVILIYELN